MKARSILNKLLPDHLAKATAALENARANLAQREGDLTAADSAIETARNARQDALAVGADDSELDRLDAAVERAELLAKRARERAAISQDLLSKSEATYAAEKLRADSDKAKAIAEAISAKLLDRYSKATRELLEIVAEIAEARVEIERLGGGIDAEEARRKFWLGETVIRDELVTLWTDRAGTILSPQPRENEVFHDREGLSIRVGEYRDRFPVERRHFRKVTVLEAEVAHQIEPIGWGLRLPGLMSGDSALWVERDGFGNADHIAHRAREAITSLDRQMKAARERLDTRQPIERFIPVDPRVTPSEGDGDQAA